MIFSYAPYLKIVPSRDAKAPNESGRFGAVIRLVHIDVIIVK
jgi:hypothetical protein